MEAEEFALPYDYHKTFYCAGGNNFYALDCLGMNLLDTDGMQMTYYLDCYEEENGDISKQNIQLPVIPDSAGLDKSVVAFDVVNEQEFVLFVQIRQEESLQNYYAVHLSMKGEYLRMVELYPAMAENNIPGIETWVYDNIHVDSQGNYYLIPEISQGEVLVLGTDGTLLHRLEAEEKGESVQFAMKDPDGNPVFKWYNSWENTILLAGYEASGGKKSYARVQIPCDMSMVLTEEGFLYYINLEGKLYRWNLRTGDHAFCMDYGDLGIGVNPSMICMAAGGDGEPVLLDFAGGNAHIYIMGTEQAVSQTMIRLVSTTSYCDYVSACAARFSREQENCVILVEKLSIVSYPHFTYIMEEYGEEYHPVGFPTDGNSGNYWVCDYFLVMNKNTSHRDILEKYLIELFDTENQRFCDRAVRSDMISRFTVADEYDPNGGQLYDKGDDVYGRLGTKPDGGSWEQEYLELMNHCVNRSDRTDPIVDIIMGEADSYFIGSKDAAAAAQVIQNRVQLYLDEQYQ